MHAGAGRRLPDFLRVQNRRLAPEAEPPRSCRNISRPGSAAVHPHADPAEPETVRGHLPRRSPDPNTTETALPGSGRYGPSDTAGPVPWARGVLFPGPAGCTGRKRSTTKIKPGKTTRLEKSEIESQSVLPPAMWPLDPVPSEPCSGEILLGRRVAGHSGSCRRTAGTASRPGIPASRNGTERESTWRLLPGPEPEVLRFCVDWSRF